MFATARRSSTGRSRRATRTPCRELTVEQPQSAESGGKRVGTEHPGSRARRAGRRNRWPADRSATCCATAGRSTRKCRGSRNPARDAAIAAALDRLDALHQRAVEEHRLIDLVARHGYAAAPARPAADSTPRGDRPARSRPAHGQPPCRWPACRTARPEPRIRRRAPACPPKLDRRRFLMAQDHTFEEAKIIDTATRRPGLRCSAASAIHSRISATGKTGCPSITWAERTGSDSRSTSRLKTVSSVRDRRRRQASFRAASGASASARRGSATTTSSTGPGRLLPGLLDDQLCPGVERDQRQSFLLEERLERVE